MTQTQPDPVNPPPQPRRPYALIGLMVAFVVIFTFGLLPAMLLTSGKQDTAASPSAQTATRGLAIAVMPIGYPGMPVGHPEASLARLVVRELTDISGLQVLAVDPEASRPPDPAGLPEAVASMPVDYVLMSAISHVGDHAHVVSRLVDVTDRSDLVVLEFDVALGTDAIEEAIATKIGDGLRARLGELAMLAPAAD